MRREIVPVLLVLLGASPASGQYFGRNKVQYRAFDFQVLRTENFDVYYYPQEREAAVDAARMVERSYARLSRILQHEFRERKPLIVYASHTDFQQTNALPSTIDEGTGGVTEALKSRMILPFTGSYADFDHVLTHELVHGFQYDVILRRGMLNDASPFVARLPLWFMEGMAEYLSIGRIDAHTVSWLRDAVLNGYLRSIVEMTQRDDYLSYRFGQSLWSYIGSKWGDEVVGILLQKAPRIGIERAFSSTLGLSLEELNREWQSAVRSTYLVQVTEYDRPQQIATRLTQHERLYDEWYLAPAVSPDGESMVYLSQRDGFSFDLWLASARTGKVRKRLIESARDASFESLRFMNSGAAFSSDGRYLAFAAKAGGQDALYLYDLRRGRVAKRLKFDLNGISNPSWSPDDRRIVFTGLDGGLSDLFITDLNGKLTRLTRDRYADLLPAWSPDGRSIAFTTDRAGTDLDVLMYGNMRVAVIDVDSRAIDLLPHQEEGKNSNAVWSPDGRKLIWVSDRTGTNDLYLFELEGRTLSRITQLLSGVIAVTPLSPVISWSRQGRLLFTYFEAAGYNTYVVEDPLALPRELVVSPRIVAAADSARAVANGNGARHAPQTAADARGHGAITGGPAEPVRTDSATAAEGRTFITSYYRAADGSFRPSTAATVSQETAAPVSVSALLDSAVLALPDTTGFEHLRYRVKLTADMSGRPSVGTQVGGYYGNGVYGGTYVSLSDMLGNHNLLLAGNVSGSLSDASFFGAYTFLKTRANWSGAIWQVPIYRYLGGGFFSMDVKGENRNVAANIFRRDVMRAAHAGLSYPFSTFSRLELNATGVHYRSDVLIRGYDRTTYEPVEIDQRFDGFSYLQPEVALVFDNALSGWTGPIYGRRYRAQVSRTFGDLQYATALLDVRNYTNWKQKIVLATRLVGLSQFGAESNRFGVFWGGPYFIRGYDYNSFEQISKECTESRFYGAATSISPCPVRDQLVGSSVVLLNSELRFPVITELQIGFLGNFPPVDAVAFFDGGLAWDSRVCRQYDYTRRDNCALGESDAVRITWDRKPGEDPYLVREPLFSYGIGLRINVFYTIVRLDYAWPVNRPDRSGVLSFSFGPSF
jgi:Tol biopolymer transport system component